MNVVVGSAFRNSSRTIGIYMAQVDVLRLICEKNSHSLRIIAAEGDSWDSTREDLSAVARNLDLEIEVVDASHGGPVYGSTEQPERMAAVSKVGNKIFEAVRETDDVLVYVESDLHWDATVLFKLIGYAAQRYQGFDVFAPMVFAGDAFYDIWGFRKSGTRFGPFYPYHPELTEAGITEVESAGSCLVMRAEVARVSRIRNNYALVDWCMDARQHGYRIGVDPLSEIKHP